MPTERAFLAVKGTLLPVAESYADATDCTLDLVSITDGDTARVYRTWTVPRTVTEIGSNLLMTEQRVFTDNPAKLPHGLPGRQAHLNTPEKTSPDWARAKADYASWWAKYEGRIRAWVWDEGAGGFSRLLIDPYVDGDPSNTLARFMLTEANDGKGWPPYVRKP